MNYKIKLFSQLDEDLKKIWLNIEKDSDHTCFNSLAWVENYISSYKESSYNDHSPTKERKLLLNKREINKLIGRMNKEGFTIVPTKMYFKNGKIKIEVAVAKGKKHYDKREVKKQRDWNREKSRLFRKTS